MRDCVWEGWQEVKVRQGQGVGRRASRIVLVGRGSGMGRYSVGRITPDAKIIISVSRGLL